MVGHSDVAPDRKQDPGELFDWQGLARNGVGLWPGPDGAPTADARAALEAIGYPVPDLAVTLRAFQRHWLPGQVTGEACAATLARLGAVLAATA